MAEFAVDPVVLAGVVTRMEGFAGVVSPLIGKTESVLSDLGVVWEGEAASAAQAALDRWQDGAQQMRVAVGELQRFLDVAGQGYARAITGNMQMWAG